MEDGTCKITISEAVSLACVKEEPLEYELSTNMTSGQEQDSSLDEVLNMLKRLSWPLQRMASQLYFFGVKENHARKFINCLTCGQRFHSRCTLMKHRRDNHSKKESEIKEKM